MLNRLETLDRIVRAGAVGIIRASKNCDLPAIVEALWEGGLGVIEITATSPGAAAAIRQVCSTLPDVLIGAGTVLDAASANRMLDAGARFLVSPSTARDVLEVAQSTGAVAIPGALTPTEIVSAWQGGGDLIKVFPAASFGPAYIRALQGPLPDIPLAPTGGVDGENAGEYLSAGATVVCVGGWLAPKDAILRGDYGLMKGRAESLVSAVAQYREGGLR